MLEQKPPLFPSATKEKQVASNDNSDPKKIDKAISSLSRIMDMAGVGKEGSYKTKSFEEKQRQNKRNRVVRRLSKTRKELGDTRAGVTSKKKVVGKNLSEIEAKSKQVIKTKKELTALKNIKKNQLAGKPQSLLNKRKAVLEAAKLKNPSKKAVKSLLVKFGLKSIPIVGSLLSAFSSTPAGKGSSLDGK